MNWTGGEVAAIRVNSPSFPLFQVSAGQEQGPILAVFLGIFPKQNLSPCGTVSISNRACEVESSVRE